MFRNFTIAAFLLLLWAPFHLPAQSTYSTDFEDGSKSSYTSGTETLNGISWTLSQALIGDSPPSIDDGFVFDRYNGSKALRIRYRSSGEQGVVSMNADVPGIARVSFKYARFGTDASPVLRVEYSTNSGSSWIQAGSDITTAGVTTLTEWSHDLNITGNVRIRIRAISGTNSRRANIDDLAFTIPGPPAPTSVTVDATAFIEGAYNGTGLNTTLNANIPTGQPYSINGHSAGETAGSIPAGAVDWVLVELREATSAAAALKSTKVGSAAGFLMDDGSIKATDGTSDLTVSLTGNTGSEFFVVVYHRNHLAIMSANPVAEGAGGTYDIDFTTLSANTYQTTSALTTLSTGKFAMPAGDADGDGDVDATDLTTWQGQNGKEFTYGNSNGDFNLDGVINAVDRNEFQQKNESKTSKVPTT